MTNKKVMIDTSILVEYIKKNKRVLLEGLLINTDYSCCINETVISEFMFNFTKVESLKAPLTVQSAKGIPSLIKLNHNHSLIALFDFLPTDDKLYLIVNRLMEEYNLLPNDAIILATCKIHNIKKLASHDSDFITPCENEGITLLRE